jgi:hypothetical protein
VGRVDPEGRRGRPLALLGWAEEVAATITRPQWGAGTSILAALVPRGIDGSSRPYCHPFRGRTMSVPIAVRFCHQSSSG